MIGCKWNGMIAVLGDNYLFCLKGNQGTLHEDVSLWFETKFKKQHNKHMTLDGDHGRIEHRETMSSGDIQWLVT